MKKDIYIINSKSCLFFNSKKGLIRINCPFKVICIIEITEFKKGEKLIVERVSTDKYNSILFTINSNLYLHKYFILHLD